MELVHSKKNTCNPLETFNTVILFFPFQRGALNVLCGSVTVGPAQAQKNSNSIHATPPLQNPTPVCGRLSLLAAAFSG